MREIFHLARFDARALRWPLVLWLLVLLAEAVQFYVGAPDRSSSTEVGRVISDTGLGLLRLAATVILTALLIHQHPTVGTSAFWRTRSMARWALLTSKILSATLWFLALPILVTVGTLMAVGLDAGDAIRGGWNAVGAQAYALIAAFAAAAITGSLLHFAIALLGAMAVASLFGSALGPWMKTVWPAVGITVYSDYRLWYWPLVLALATAATIHQYLTLRLRTTIAVLAGVVAAASLMSSLTTIDYSREPRFRPPDTPVAGLDPAGVSIRMDPATAWAEPSSILAKTPGAVVSFRTSIAGAPPVLSIEPRKVESEIAYPDGSRTTWSSEWIYPQSIEKRSTAQLEFPYTAVSELLGHADVALPGPAHAGYWSRLVVGHVPIERFQQFRGRPVRISGRVSCWVWRVRLNSTVALRAGSRIPLRSGAGVIRSVDLEPAGIKLTIRQTEVGGTPMMMRSEWLVLYNESRRQAVLTQSGSRRSWTGSIFYSLASIRSYFFQESVSQADLAPGSFTIDSTWIAGARLVAMNVEGVGAITRPFVIEDVPLEDTRK